MNWSRPPADLGRLCVRPLAQRRSLSTVEQTLVDPTAAAPDVADDVRAAVVRAAEQIRAARVRRADVLLIYGAHLLRNGAAQIVAALMADGWLTHLATNGAGTIHDWEYAWLGRSTESVRDGVAMGQFGAWDETGRNLQLALLAAGVSGEGYGRAVGRLIAEDGLTLPDPLTLAAQIRHDPHDPLTAARAELLATMQRHALDGGEYPVVHEWKQASILASAFRLDVPLTVHPGIGYDIIVNHPMFNGAAVGRAGYRDFAQFCAAVDGLDGGVVLSIGSAIMGPQVFEKSLSCVNNLRLQAGRPIVHRHSIWVVDIQNGGGWDWGVGEPPKTSPAYYLRFCKSYSRMGGTMHYAQADNLAFVHHLYHELTRCPHA